LWSYIVFVGSLSLSISAYRLSPFHPLAQYPGPAIGKVTKLWGLWKASKGYKYLYFKELHDTYGAYVRTGKSSPNELSIIDASAIYPILNFGGLEKGRYYESGRHSATPPSIVCLSGEAHTAKRRVWNRAMTSAAQREYEPLVARRAGQLVERLREQKGPLDFVKWIDLFSMDLMGDLAFGGGFEMLHCGADFDGVGERIRGYMKATHLASQIPWIVSTLHLLPQVGREIQDFNDFGRNLAMRRMKNGAVAGRMDLWYHLADEPGLEGTRPSLETCAADGIVAVVAATDTVASTLTSLVWFLLSHREYYMRVQREVDSVVDDDTSEVNVENHKESKFLDACMSETLRLHPPLPTNGTRQVHLHQPGRSIAGRYIPPGTSVYTPAYSLHRNPAYFSPHPDEFHPERWLPEQNLEFDKHDTTAFLPFSLGPANCVGQKFAQREIFRVVCTLFKAFEMRLASKSDNGLDVDACKWPGEMRDFFVFTRGALWVELTPRNW
ncbi:cytochrome P450, partial [Mycena albidolilacea]